MKTDKEQQYTAKEPYTAPATEVIEMEVQNMMALSDPGIDDVPSHDPDKPDFWGD